MPQARNGPAPEQGGGRLKSPPTGRYVHDPEPILKGLYAIEPAFIALVKKRS